MELERPRPLGEQISAALRREIVTGAMPQGEAVKEESLAARFAVSRGPVREALRTLENEALIHKVGRSYEVIGISEADIDEIYAIRRGLESVAWSVVANHTAGADLSAAEASLRALRLAAKNRDQSAFAEADIDFHSAIANAAGLKRLSAFWEQLEPSIRMIVDVTNAVDRDMGTALARHETLFKAVRDGDEAETLRLLDSHLKNSRQIIPARGQKAQLQD